MSGPVAILFLGRMAWKYMVKTVFVACVGRLSEWEKGAAEPEDRLVHTSHHGQHRPSLPA
jgi:hypothetical protein